MTTFLQYAVDAFSAGALYALIALSLALLFSVMGLMNFAYGELIMIGGYTMIGLRDMPIVVLVAGTVLAVVIASLIMERLAFRPLRDASPATLLMTSFAVSFLLQSVARMTVGSIPKGVRPFDGLSNAIEVGGVRIDYIDLLTIATTITLLLGMLLLLRRTMFGIQLRASTEDFRVARLQGVRADRVIAGAFAVTGVLAAAVALLFFARNGAVTPTIGLQPALIAFVGAVIGGLGSLWGAAVGGFLLGAFTTVLQASLPVDLAAYTPAIAFAFVIAILVLKPDGLLGRRLTSA